MCGQPDYDAHMRVFDNALVELFLAWAAMMEEYVDADESDPQDWCGEFSKEVLRHLPELKRRPEYMEKARRLDSQAGVTPAIDAVQQSDA